MSFKRTRSKMWYGFDIANYRDISSSPGSMDSGFSDTENSPQNSQKKRSREESDLKIENKSINSEDKSEIKSEAISSNELVINVLKNQNGKENLNLSSNYKEKSTPIKENIENRLIKSDFLRKIPNNNNNEICSAPVRKQRYTKYSPKVSRKLFTNKKTSTKECLDTNTNQYSNLTPSNNLRSTEEINNEENSCCPLNSTAEDYDIIQYENTSSCSSEISGTKSVPLLLNKSNSNEQCKLIKNHSAPAAILNDSYDQEFCNSFTSECSDKAESESELERLFSGSGVGPEYTSTPKTDSGDCCLNGSMRHRRGKRSRLESRITKSRTPDLIERIPPIYFDYKRVENEAVQRWLNEARLFLDQECTITLQCKSIADELNQKINYFASTSTVILRDILAQSRSIEMEFSHLKSENHPCTSVQNLAENILGFFNNYSIEVNEEILKVYNRIENLNVNNLMGELEILYHKWKTIKNQLLLKEIKQLMDTLEDPVSEISLKATLTGITSVVLRNSEIIDYFLKADIVPILLIQCEKCEGSSMRTIILRALSTMCCNSYAIRQFEKYSGTQIIADTLKDQSRPEPERSEAVALLAQITAPWLEETHTIKDLKNYSKRLIHYLTKFASATKCCQNLLLCIAALANLSSMNTDCVEFLVEFNTITALLSAVQIRGPRVSIYIYEQLATLLANMSATEEVRQHLTDTNAVTALVHFLRSSTHSQNDEVERRVQQKSIIALSRLCSDRTASRQLVENGGLTRLIQLCREKEERFNSDAVLVATLATLRKITEVCGADIMDVQDYQELVEPKLLDSFLAYSTQNESYV